jgi:hypothetical protein
MKSLVKMHFQLEEEIQRRRWQIDHRPEALEHMVKACNQQISIAPEVAQLLKKTSDSTQPGAETTDLPEHSGYSTLATLRESQGRFAEAICLSREAKFQGWADDWDERIARCEQKRG